MTSRVWKRIALFVGIPLLLLACVGIIRLVVRTPKEEVVVSRKEIPSDWLAPPATQTGSLAVPEEIGQPADVTVRMRTTYKDLSGTLAVMANGKQFGEESYELHETGKGGLGMVSHGTFSFRVVFATLKAGFSQEIELDGDLRPDSYSLDLDGPLGIGSRHVEGTIVGDTVRVTSGDKEEEMRIEYHDPLVLGTFSTYALIPLLMIARENEGALQFQVIPLLGGKGKDSDAGNGDSKILLRIERTGNRVIRTGSGEVIADEYLLTSNMGDSILLGRGEEFLALIATSDKGSLVAYRSDFFPDGIDLSQ